MQSINEILEARRKSPCCGQYLAGGRQCIGCGADCGRCQDGACRLCEGTGVVWDGQHDDMTERVCPNMRSEELDFSGATEGDR